MSGRFPFAPLIPYIERAWRPLNSQPHVGGGMQNFTIAGKTAVVLDIDSATVYRWMKEGMTPRIADRAAVHLGYHPSLIWTDWFDVDVPDDINLFAGACGKGTWGGIKGHQRRGESFCGPCRQFKAEYEARWRVRNPDLERARFTRNNRKRRAA